MNPLNDLVCNLLETPFSRWCAEDKQDILKYRRTTSHINITMKKVKSGGRSYNIQFQDSWYADCNWLCGSHYNEKLYCWPCLLLGNKKPAWNSTGFCDFRNVNRGLYSHADSAEHIKCILQLKALQKNMNTIADALKESYRLYVSQFNENVRLNRLVMHTAIDTVLFLSKQELAFRGHDESISSQNRGNFKELLALISLAL